jgi:BlaI family transcriptional regulator, penicillinase repressor
MPGKEPLPSVGPLENAVLHVLWQRGTATADEVRAALEPSRKLKESTVRTLLRRLERKGFVAHEVDGRTFIYRPSVAPQNVATQAVRGIIDRFCSGSVEALLTGMVDGELITPHKLRQLADKIADAERKAPKSKKSNK